MQKTRKNNKITDKNIKKLRSANSKTEEINSELVSRNLNNSNLYSFLFICIDHWLQKYVEFALVVKLSSRRI